MRPETLQAMREHAVREYPRECCGLVVVVKGRERYIACRNEADKPGDHFILPAAEYAAAEDLGEIVAVVHSHPDTLRAQASEGDRVACEGSGLPWYIIAVAKADDGAVCAGEVHRLAPEGYEAPLVGRPFHHGVLDCYALCRDWYKREWELELPDFERRDQWWNDGHSDLYTQHFAECGFVPVAAPEQPGDAILMQVQSRNGVPNHAAIYLGNGQILHHLYGRLSSRDVYGGMWRDYTRLTLRHRSAMLGIPKQEGMP